uniref:SH3 domain-containing protein n=1 Tax=Parastrongyloides trichosuri TaxID=131310 RepID=A0A0N4Z3W6_PARTI
MSNIRRGSLQHTLFRETNFVDNNEKIGDYRPLIQFKKIMTDPQFQDRHNSFTNLKHSPLFIAGRYIHPKQAFLNGHNSAPSSNVSPQHRRSQPTILYFNRPDPFDCGTNYNREDMYPYSIVEGKPIYDCYGGQRSSSNVQKRLPSTSILRHTPSQPILKLGHNASSQSYNTAYTPVSTPYESPISGRKLPMKPITQQRLLRRAPKSDLYFRFQRHLEENDVRSIERNSEEVDPVYLALKQAHKTYGRRSSSSHNYDSISPSPRNLSQTSLQDSGYVEAGIENRTRLLGSTPLLNQQNISSHNCQNTNYGQISIQQQPSGVYSPVSNTTTNQVQQYSIAKNRPPKLEKQMKSLSLDCADMPPVITSNVRSPYRNGSNSGNNMISGGQSKPQSSKNIRLLPKHGDGNDYEKTTSSNSQTASPRKLPSQNIPSSQLMHIVIHEYRSPKINFCLTIGQRMRIVDNGDPDWLHGFLLGDHTETLLTFPSTCVSPIYGNEQPMRVSQNIMIPDTKLRLYRDQVVFAQADTIRTDNKVLVRTERDKFAHCPLTNLQIL